MGCPKVVAAATISSQMVRYGQFRFVSCDFVDRVFVAAKAVLWLCGELFLQHSPKSHRDLKGGQRKTGN